MTYREKMCRCCNRKKANRPRGLCWHCYYTPGVRDQYPSTSKYVGRQEIKDRNGRCAEPAATEALPGTRAKFLVLQERAQAGCDLWHPADAIGLPPDDEQRLPQEGKQYGRQLWSPVEDELIRRLYPVLGRGLALQFPHRGWRSVQERARLLGVRCRPGRKREA